MDSTPSTQAIADKIQRLRDGLAPRVFDLFSGCGGLSLGFVTAGCTSVGSVEADPDAARTFAFNFHPEDLKAHGRPRRVEAPTSSLIEDTATGPADSLVDVVVGGPPCPTFSRIGRAKLNHLRQEKGLFEDDSRGELYLKFIGHVAALKPLAILMENVPEFLSHGGQNLGLDAARRLQELGYCPAYTLLNAAAYGVPQWRERFFLLAIHRDLGIEFPSFPTPVCNTSSLPRGMELNRKAALNRIETCDHGQLELFGSNSWWTPDHPSTPDMPPPVTASQAIGDLPEYLENRELRLTRTNNYWEDLTWRKHESYSDEPYVILMRRWPGLSPPPGIPSHQHTTRHTTAVTGRDIEIFRRMNPGDEFPKAMRIAEENYSRKIKELGVPPTPLEAEQIRKECVPPYDDSKFPNKWWMLRPDEPVRTLTAHLCKDSYSHIHYDRNQARMITVQEAARLQSFPDSFVFRSGMNSSFRQIGNSVPPLLAWHIAAGLLQQLSEATGYPLHIRLPWPGTVQWG